MKYLAEAKMVDAIAKRRIIEEDLYECGLDVHHYLFFLFVRQSSELLGLLVHKIFIKCILRN